MAMKQIEPTMVKVGGNDYYITPFPAFKAANLTGELASVLAPLFAVIAPLVSEESGNWENVEVSKVATAMAGCTALDGNKLEILMKNLLTQNGNIAVEYYDENGNKKAERLTQDLANELFCGDVLNMFVLCFHVIRLNFSGFFEKLATQYGTDESVPERTVRAIY